MRDRKITRDFSNPKFRKEYFKPTDGKPPDDLILRVALRRIAVLRRNKRPNYVYTTEQLCHEIWPYYANHHVYIGHRIKALIAEGKLPLRKVAKKSNRHVLYQIVDD